MKNKGRPFLYFAILSCIYIVLSLVLPVNRHTLVTYHLSNAQYHVLILTIILPLVAIWFAAFYGYAKLQEYAETVQKTPEGPSFKTISRGAAWLAWTLPASSISSVIFTAIANVHPGFHNAAVIVDNYISLFFGLVAFIIISRGTRGLTDIVRPKPNLFGFRNLIVLFITIGVVFCYTTLNNIIDAHHGNPYHLPVWLLLFTIIVPYLYAWFLGLLAAYEVGLYSKNVKGVLYKQALNLLGLGIIGVIVTSITIQYLSSLSASLNHLTLGYLLVVIYVLLILYAVGYLLIALGAKKLRKIEEV